MELNTLEEIRVLQDVIGAPIDPVSWPLALSRISTWAAHKESRYVCICNVHSVVTSRQDFSFAEAIRSADLATPDGAPVAWLMRKVGIRSQQRINGPDLMWKYCTEAATRKESIFLYGSTEETLAKLHRALIESFPTLQIAGCYSPPFRPLTVEEDEEVVKIINESGAGTVWVSLGCPKQEKWMAAHKGRINAVMIGVGAAFDYHAGTIRRAPLWMQQRGLEWSYRLASEPRRLWKRYLVSNSLFLAHATLQVARFNVARLSSVVSPLGFGKRT